MSRKTTAGFYPALRAVGRSVGVRISIPDFESAFKRLRAREEESSVGALERKSVRAISLGSCYTEEARALARDRFAKGGRTVAHQQGIKPVAQNKKAYHEYFVEAAFKGVTR